MSATHTPASHAPRHNSRTLRQRIEMMPKVELHCHLDGSLRAETLITLAREAGIPLPFTEPAALERFMCADQVTDLDAYLARFDITVSVMQTAEALERIAYELIEDAAKESIRYIEVRAAPHLFTRGSLSLDEATRAIIAGLAHAQAVFGTKARFIVCSLRHWDPAQSLDAARLAVRFKDRGVVAFDLAGSEAKYPAAAHAEAFLYARLHNLPVTCHAGEAAGAESVRQAVHVCGAHRIGHGTRIVEDGALLQYVIDRRIPLEVCLASNVQTRVVSRYAEHPALQLLQQGAAVTLNTDNRMISGVTLTDEYLTAINELGFTERDLKRTVLNSCDGAFLPYDERKELRREILDAFAMMAVHAK